MAKYDVAGKPYRTKIDDYRGTICGKCGKRISKNRPAIGIRTGHSFGYYHITCYPKSWSAKQWKKRGG